MQQSDTYDILLVESDPAEAERVRAAFASHTDQFLLRVASDVAAARAQLAGCAPSLVIADLDLPDGGAAELIPASPCQAYPVIVLANHGDERAALEVMRAGALDYVVKSETAFEDMPHIAEHAVSEWQVRDDRGRAREAERAFGARLKAILEAVPDILVELDATGTIGWTNEAGREFFGADALGEKMATYGTKAPGDQDTSDSPLNPGAWYSDKRWFRRADGEARLLAWRSGAVDDLPGRPATLLASARDITSSHQLERQFLHAQKLEAMGALTSGIAHDFNNLLMGVRGCADMCLRAIDERHPARELVEDIKNETSRGAALTRQLLTFSRKRKVELAVTDLNALVAQSEHMLRRLLSANILLRVQLTAVDGRLRADAGQLEQVLWNLVVNARDAMPEGGRLTITVGEITIDSEAMRRFGEMAPGTYLTLTVADDGCGMDEATLACVFEPFFTTKEDGEGTGLGLSTTYGLVRQHGGDIQISSKPDQGTTVRVYLPRGVEALANPDDTGEYPASLRGDETILVVEDEPLVRRTVVHYLQRWGYQVIEASAGKEALCICQQRQKKIDLLLVDFVLPGLSGADVARQASELRPGLRVLHMSAYPHGKLVRDGMLSATTTLHKPFTEDQLLTVVRDTLSLPTQRFDEVDPAESCHGTILLVEDHGASRRAVKLLFEQEGYVVLAAVDGAGALKLSGDYEATIDVLLTDLGLPDLDGEQLLRRLRAQRPLDAVVFMSGRNAEDPTSRRATSVPGACFVEKPIDFVVLKRMVDDLIGLKGNAKSQRR